MEELDPSKEMSHTDKWVPLLRCLATSSHDELAALNFFRRSFINTGTWMLMHHLLALESETSRYGRRLHVLGRTPSSRASSIQEESRRWWKGSFWRRKKDLLERKGCRLHRPLRHDMLFGTMLIGSFVVYREKEHTDACLSVVNALALKFRWIVCEWWINEAYRNNFACERRLAAILLSSFDDNWHWCYHGKYGDGLLLSNMDGAISRIVVNGVDSLVDAVYCAVSSALENNDTAANHLPFEFQAHTASECDLRIRAAHVWTRWLFIDSRRSVWVVTTTIL